MTVQQCTDLAHELVARFNDRRSDEELFADGALVWNNLNEQERPHAETAPVSDALRAALPDLRWDEVAVHAWPEGFCVRYTFTATLPDGAPARVPTCSVAEVVDGRIVRFSEYLDSAQVTPLGQAMLQSLADAAE